MNYSYSPANKHYSKIPASTYYQSTPRQRIVRAQQSPRIERESKNDVISVSIPKLRQFLDQYKRQIVSQQDIISNLQSLSRQIKQRQTQQQLPRQISLLNQIKQNNQRILKGKIRDLQLKLLDKSGCTYSFTNLQALENQKNKLQATLAEKDSRIKQLSMLNIQLQQKIEVFNCKIAKFQVQVNKTEIQILKMKDYIKYLQSIVKLNEQIRQNYKSQQSQTVILSKSCHFRICSQLNQKFVGISRECQSEQARTEIQILQNSNSYLRKQLIRLHTYLEEQDEKNSRKIQNLQQKIKKLTQFNARANDPMKESTISTPSYRYNSHNKRNSDLNLNNIIGERRISSSRVIKLADLKIQLQLKSQRQYTENKFTNDRTQPNSKYKQGSPRLGYDQ